MVTEVTQFLLLGTLGPLPGTVYPEVVTHTVVLNGLLSSRFCILYLTYQHGLLVH